MKFAICNEIFQGWKLEDTFAYAAQAGYDGVEIAPFTLANSVNDISAAERRRIREAAARAGVEIVGLHWLLVKPEGLHLTSPDAALRERTARYFGDPGGRLRRFRRASDGGRLAQAAPHAARRGAGAGLGVGDGGVPRAGEAGRGTRRDALLRAAGAGQTGGQTATGLEGNPPDRGASSGKRANVLCGHLWRRR